MASTTYSAAMRTRPSRSSRASASEEGVGIAGGVRGGEGVDGEPGGAGSRDGGAVSQRVEEVAVAEEGDAGRAHGALARGRGDVNLAVAHTKVAAKSTPTRGRGRGGERERRGAATSSPEPSSVEPPGLGVRRGSSRGVARRPQFVGVRRRPGSIARERDAERASTRRNQRAARCDAPGWWNARNSSRNRGRSLLTPPPRPPGPSRSMTEKLRPQFFPRLAVGHADARRARDRRARAMAAQAATLSSDDGSAPADALVDYLRMANTADVLAAIRASAGVGGAEDGDGDGDANGDGDGDARSAREGGLEGFGAAAQRALVAILEHPISVLHPPGRAYRARLLKAAALAAERSGDDLDDRLAEAHAATLVAPDDDGWCHKTFAYGPSHLAVTVRAHVNLFEGGTGCHEWPAGFYLAEIAATHPHIFAGRRVVELGAGTGITAAVVARPPATPQNSRCAIAISTPW